MRYLTILLFVASAFSAEDTFVQEIIKANNLFTPNVYKQISENCKNNFLISPFSTETALAIVQSGSKGETAEELQTVLHLPKNTEKIEHGIKNLLPTLVGNEQYSLVTTNKIYLKEKFAIKETFRKTIVEIYNAHIEKINFTNQKEAANTMNSWVEEQTQHKIQNLVDPNILDEDTRAILINALYFKANWASPFPLTNTRKANFYKTAEDVVQVDTMHRSKKRSRYYECPHLNAKFLEMAFKGQDASMTIILPNEKEGLAALENQIERVFTPHNLTSKLVNVALPKFKIETKIDFKPILRNLGANKMFEDEEVDLSGIAGEKGDLGIEEVIQKTFIDVSEKGVEAAAATFVEIKNLMKGSKKAPKEFTADHPFIFYIKIKEVIVFAGRVIDPGQ